MSDSIERHGERFGIYPLGGQLYAEGTHVTGGTVSIGGEPEVLLHSHEITGTLGEANATVSLVCDGSIGSVVFQVSGTWKGKIVVEGTIDSNYNTLSVVQPGGAISSAGINNDNQNGVYRILIPAGYSTIRLRMSEYTSGTASIIMRGAQVVASTYAWQLNAANLQTTATQGAAGATAWKVDGSGVTQPVSGTVAATQSGTWNVTTTRADDFFSDAFQRQRVSNTDQRLDVEFLYDKQPLLFEELVTGTGTVTHNTNARDVTIAIGGTASNAAAGLFQHFYNPYTPGNSQFIALTGVLNGANLAGTAAIFRRSSVSGTVTEEVVNQTGWLAATAGVNWNFSQIFLMDFQSLKIGRIRFALDRGGLAVPVATIDNDNERAEGYWQLANAPIFWRVYNTADATVTELGYGDSANAIGFRFTSALSASQTMRATCATVKSEGGGNLLDIAGYKFAAANGATLRTVSNSFVPVLSLQLKTTFGAGTNRGLVFPQALSIQCDNPLYYEVRINPTLTNASFASVNANSLCNVDVAATAISGGRVIAAGYASSGSTRAGATQISLTGKAPLSVDYAGTVGDIITVACIRTSTTNAATGVAVEWKEVR